VENLFETLRSGKFFGLDEELVDASLVSRILSIPEGERFDIVLSWDLVNYFKPAELRAPIGYLETFCAKGAFFFTIFFGGRSLRVAVAEFLIHFHAERNHQGLGNRLIEPGEEVGRTAGEVVCRERLGGMLRYYYRQAA